MLSRTTALPLRTSELLSISLRIVPAGGSFGLRRIHYVPHGGCPEIRLGEPSLMLINVDRRKSRAQPRVILLQAVVARLGETEYEFENAE